MVGAGGASRPRRRLPAARAGGVRAGGAADVAAAAGAAGARRGRRRSRSAHGWIATRPATRARRVLVAGRAARRCRRAPVDRALLARDVGSGARRGAAEAADAGRAGPALHRDAGREPRPARLSRAADRVHDVDAASRSGVRAGRRVAAARSDPPADAAKPPRRGGPRCSTWRASARDHLADAVAAALTVPLATDWHVDARSRPTATGAARRIGCATGRRPRSALVDELIDLGVEQIILVSAAPESPGPHALAAPRLDGRGRLGEYLQSSEAAVVRDAHDHHRRRPRCSRSGRRTTRSGRSTSPAATTIDRTGGRGSPS